MITIPENIDDIVAIVASKFRTFGGGIVDERDPVSIAFKNSEFQFKAGVSVKDVVVETISQCNQIIEKQNQPE